MSEFDQYLPPKRASTRSEFDQYLTPDASMGGHAAKPAKPSLGQVATNAVAKGVAGVPDMFLNIPANIENLGRAGYGMLLSGLGRPDLMADLSLREQPNLVNRGLQRLGAIKTEHEPQTGGQRVVDTAVQGATGMLFNPAAGVKQVMQNVGTGLLGGTASGVTKEATGSDLAATLAGIAAPLGVQGARAVSQRKLSTPLPTVRQQTFQDAKKEGYVVPPTEMKPSFLNERLESMGGKAATSQEASIRNQAVTNRLAAQDIGFPAGTEITQDVLDAVRKQAGAAYEKIQSLNPGGELRGLKVRTLPERAMMPGPTTGLSVSETRGAPVPTGLKKVETRDKHGKLIGMKIGQTTEGTVGGPLKGIQVKETSRGQDVPGPLQGLKVSVKETRGGNPLEQLKQFRHDANAYYRHYEVSADPKSLQRAKIAQAKADAIEQDFERLAQASGNPELIQNLRAARTLIAKTYSIERAMNVGDASIDARRIGRDLDKGKPLTGGLKTIGRFAEAFPSSARAGVSRAGVSALEPMASVALGGAGYGLTDSPYGLALAALPFARRGARSLTLSKPYQHLMTNPNAGLPTQLMAKLPRRTAMQTALQSALLANATQGKPLPPMSPDMAAWLAQQTQGAK